MLQTRFKKLAHCRQFFFEKKRRKDIAFYSFIKTAS
ncbi:hypothetical protein DNO_1169 [Dichelobacter nodosus VCS1703A]|uniref:Uncharacterized protein n=1 Tax=Dichelobacter nodosus (strain VCS1703A) TaxID=246195 RepID=A5EXI5_DICNV|nr:hypothetical protein DNO_1169 [Dichelobacter nodosus VCS1703A]